MVIQHGRIEKDVQVGTFGEKWDDLLTLSNEWEKSSIAMLGIVMNSNAGYVQLLLIKRKRDFIRPMPGIAADEQ